MDQAVEVGGVTQGQPGMELSLFSRDVIAMATAVGLSHNMFELSRMAQGIGLGVWSAIADFHAIATS